MAQGKLAKPTNAPLATPLILPPAEDYLGQWLLALSEHYRQEVTQLSGALYRLTLKHLTNRELDLAFTETIARHKTGFLPVAGEILEYLREARTASYHAVLALPEPALSEEEKQQRIAEVQQMKRKVESLGELKAIRAPVEPEECMVYRDDLRIADQKRRLADYLDRNGLK